MTPATPVHVLRRLLVVLSLAGVASTAAAQETGHVQVTSGPVVARSCPEASCKQIAELASGESAPVVKTEGDWHQVILRLPGARATTGWVEARQVTLAPRPAVRAARDPSRPAAAPRPADGPAEDRDCLTCVATRQPTPAEWKDALAATATKKASPDDRPRRDPGAADVRSSSERMRDNLEGLYGTELKRLGGLANDLERDLQTYLTACYERFLPVPVEGAAPRAAPSEPSARPVKVSPRTSLLTLLHGQVPFAWNETWTTQSLLVSENAAFCQGLWNDVSGRAAAIRARLDELELGARRNDIYPGVVRDALADYGLSEPRSDVPVP